MYDYLICVATVNGPQRLENFLKTVREYTVGINYAISIIDDCSDQQMSSDNYELAVKYNCFYRRNEKRSGVPYSWNRASEAIDSKYIVIANDDILVVPGWLHAYNDFWQANSHLDLGVIAWPATNILGDQSKSFDFNVSVDYSHISNPIVACSGYLFAFSRQLFSMVGGFDERYFATWEEIDFGAKLCMNNLKSVGLSSPIIYHQGGASFSDPINQHPNMKKQSLAQSQWIDKWSNILNIKKTSNDQEMIKKISVDLVKKIPNYNAKDFNSITINFTKAVIPREDIDGWFDWPNIYLEEVQKAKEKSLFVEIGSWMGKSACFMAENIILYKKDIEFDCIDLWDDSTQEQAYQLQLELAKSGGKSLEQRFLSNLKRYNVSANTIKSLSWEAAKYYNNESIDFIFLDAAHDYDSVTKDLIAWWPKLKINKRMAGHDYFYSMDGVNKAVNDFFKNKNIKVYSDNQCWYVIKNG